MKITSKLSEKCKKCPNINVCEEKRMEACACLEMSGQCMEPAASPSADCAHAEVLVKHDYRDIKINPTMTVSLDLEAVKKQIERDVYKGVGLCLEFGA